MSKKITIIPATGGAFRDLTIEPGTTVGDIRQTLGLSSEHVLTRGQGAEPIPEGENLYETLANGAKIYSTTPVEWGGALTDWILGIKSRRTRNDPSPYLHPSRNPQQPAARVVVHRTYVPPGQGIIRVQREPLPYWQERGWTRDGEKYAGQYHTPHGTWPGWITESASGRVDAFIHRPPSRLKRHPHWPCFRDRGQGWFWVHPTKDVPDVSAAILAVEKTIAEAFNCN